MTERNLEETAAERFPARVSEAGSSVPEPPEEATLAGLDPDLAARGDALESMAHAATLPRADEARVGSAHCQRCEVLPRKLEGPGTLFLNLPHTHTLGKTMRWLRGSGLEYGEEAGVIAVKVPAGSLAPWVGPFVDLLSATERVHTRVAYQPGAQGLRRLDPFGVEDLATFAARAQGDWLIDLLREKRLISHFQPIVECKTGKTFGHECLVRGHCEGETILPGAIFDAARRADLLFQTDLAARRTALKTAAEIGLPGDVFVNFAPNAIFDARHCLDSTVRLIDELGISRERIVFEITEADRLPELEHLTEIVGYYRDKGFKVALDDVGSGFSSLRLLLHLRPEYVKIDLDLVRNVHAEPHKAILTRKLLETAQELHLKTIFEGVETEAEWGWAREHGVDYAQGYLFGRPSQILNGRENYRRL